MNYETAFSLAGVLSMVGWAALLLSPLSPRWADRIAGIFVPGALSLGYLAILLLLPGPESGGFSSFAQVTALFAHPAALLAGWVHFLAFDLIVGTWICRKARSDGLPFWAVLPCLPVTFLLGPAGFAMFIVLRTLAAFRRAPAA